MIVLWNKDGFIFDLEHRVVDIIHEYQTTGKVMISVNNEGICLGYAKFYQILDYVCDKFIIDKSKVTVFTSNLLEQHIEYNIVQTHNHWFYMTKQAIPENYFPAKNHQLKTVGCFVGKVNWNRLIILYWIYNNYIDKSLLTCHYRHEDPQKLNLELTELNFHSASDLNSIEFLKHCPITLDEKFTKFTIGPPDHLSIITRYEDIFLDLVIETYVMGNSFFPTEKTFRPIIAKTPFIIMGPVGYLQNLKAHGYQTFDKWWDEGYDSSGGINRINGIKKLLIDIFSWSPEYLQSTLIEMETVLEHNRNHYFNIHKF